MSPLLVTVGAPSLQGQVIPVIPLCQPGLHDASSNMSNTPYQIPFKPVLEPGHCDIWK